MKVKQERVKRTFRTSCTLEDLPVFPCLFSSCECHSPAIVFHPCSVMKTGKQWSVDTIRQVKALMSIGLPLPRIAAQTGVVLQTLRRFSARLKEGHISEKHSNHRGAPAKQTDEMKRWVSDYLLARPRANVSEVHIEFKKSDSDLSRSTLWRIMHSQRRPVKPIRTHKVRSVECKRRVDFCVDMLSRLHRFDQLQGKRRRIPVKLRCVPADMALDPARLCFQDEALMRCSQQLLPQHQRVWIDRGMSNTFAASDERLSQRVAEQQRHDGQWRCQHA